MNPTRDPDLTIGPRTAENGQNGPASARTPARSTASPSRSATAPPGAVSGPPPLTPREHVLLGHIVAGLTAGQIAARMGLSVGAYRTVLFRLRKRLRVETTPQLVHRAHELGLFEVRRPAPVVALREVPSAVATAPVPHLLPSIGDGLSHKPRATAADARLIAARLEASMRRDGS